jgi:hypothetical protein
MTLSLVQLAANGTIAVSSVMNAAMDSALRAVTLSARVSPGGLQGVALSEDRFNLLCVKDAKALD